VYIVTEAKRASKFAWLLSLRATLFTQATNHARATRPKTASGDTRRQARLPRVAPERGRHGGPVLNLGQQMLFIPKYQRRTP